MIWNVAIYCTPVVRDSLFRCAKTLVLFGGQFLDADWSAPLTVDRLQVGN